MWTFWLAPFLNVKIGVAASLFVIGDLPTLKKLFCVECGDSFTGSDCFLTKFYRLVPVLEKKMSLSSRRMFILIEIIIQLWFEALLLGWRLRNCWTCLGSCCLGRRLGDWIQFEGLNGTVDLDLTTGQLMKMRRLVKRFRSGKSLQSRAAFEGCMQRNSRGWLE